MVDKTKIGAGVTTFTVFNSKDKPLCERLYFQKQGSTTTFNIKSDRDLYTIRQQVNVSLSEQLTAGNNVRSIYQHRCIIPMTLVHADQPDIVNYMWLGSELVGKIASPDFYFSKDPGVDEALDNLMLTQGWRRFNWDQLLVENRKTPIKYLPEYNGHLVTGRLKDTRSGMPVPNVIAFLSIPGRPFGFYSSKSDSAGWVQFEVKNYYGNGIIIAQPDMQADSFYKVEILAPFAGPDTSRYPFSYTLTAGKADELLKRSISMQVQNVYSSDSMKRFEPPVVTDTLTILWKARSGLSPG